MTRCLIFGAGLAGLSAAHHLGEPSDIFEKSAFIGGHCHTKSTDGFAFDEGAHVFFGKDDCSEEFVWKPLAGQMTRQQASIWNNYGERRYGRYPVQVNAHALPADVATQCVLDFIRVNSNGNGEMPRNYEEWCYQSFGQSFADTFMLRYARKVWTVEPSQLTTDWLGSSVGGRVARPSLEQVIRGAIDHEPQTLNYLTEFSYPNQGGFGRIVEPLASHIDPQHVKLSCGIRSIESAAHRVTLTDGSTAHYEAAISTLPLPLVVELTTDAPQTVKSAAANLMWTSVRCVNIGIARPNVGPGHWVYFYDHDIPFFRVSFPSTLSANNAPPDCGSISCEIAYSRTKPLDARRLVARVVEALREVGILQPDDRVVFDDEIDIPYAYVVYDFKRQASVDTIHAWMKSVDLYPCGRFGEWGYHWSFEAIESGRRVAAEVARRLS